MLAVSAGTENAVFLSVLRLWPTSSGHKAATGLRRDIMAATAKNLEDMRLGEEKLTEHVRDLSSMRHASSAI